MKRKRNYLLVAMATAISVLVIAGCSEKNAQVERAVGQGRSWETTGLGALSTFEGTLSFGDPEWDLATETGSIHLGLGNPSYLESTGLKLEDEMEVIVKGYLTEDELSVVSLTVDGREVAFRTEDGAPLWSGRGMAAAQPAVPQDRAPLREDPEDENAFGEPGITGGGPPEGRGRDSESRGRGRGGGSGRWETENRGDSAKSI